MSKVLNEMLDAVRRLQALGPLPSQVEVTPAQYRALMDRAVKGSGSEPFLGLRVVVVDPEEAKNADFCTNLVNTPQKSEKF